MAKELGKTCIYNFQFAVLGSSRFWGRRSPTRALSKSNKCPNAGPEQQRPKAGYHHGDGILPFVLYPPVLSWESVVYSAWFNNSEFEKVSEWDTTIQDTMEEYDNVER